MKIYIDFDDVITETARGLADLLKRVCGRTVPYEEIREFDLRKSFSLPQDEYVRFMETAHSDAELSVLKEMPGAAAAMRKWKDCGIDPVVVTGRPAWSNSVSREWLDLRGLHDIPLIYVDKYSRRIGPDDNGVKTHLFSELADMGFSLAVDDAPPALDLLAVSGMCPYVIFDRPWNRGYTAPEGCEPQRAASWAELDAIVSRAAKQEAR